MHLQVVNLVYLDRASIMTTHVSTFLLLFLTRSRLPRIPVFRMQNSCPPYAELRKEFIPSYPFFLNHLCPPRPHAPTPHMHTSLPLSHHSSSGGGGHPALPGSYWAAAGLGEGVFLPGQVLRLSATCGGGRGQHCGKLHGCDRRCVGCPFPLLLPPVCLTAHLPTERHHAPTYSTNVGILLAILYVM